MSVSPARALLLAARPRTLTAALVPVMVGTALVAHLGARVIWWRSVVALLGAAAIQIGTNLFNDVLDFDRGADTAGRVGPVRATQAGLLTPRQVRLAAYASFTVALACGVPLVAVGGVPILALGLLSLVFGYAYTGGPYPLAYHGLGEVFVLAFFGVGAVGGTVFLHTQHLEPAAVLAGVQVGALACALLAVNNLRDVDEDARADKRTLAVRWGVWFGRLEIAAFALGPFVIGLGWLGRRAPWAALLPVVAWPLAQSAVKRVLHDEPGPSYNRVLARAAGLQLVFGTALALGLAV